MILLQTTDFKGGKYDLPDSVGAYTTANVQETIDRYEKNYIYKLLGVALGNLIIAYLAANRLPINAAYNKILDPFAEDNSGFCFNRVIESMGMKEYLKAAIFYEYVKVGLITSQPGVTQPISETANIQTPMSTMRFAENKFNDVIGTLEAIQWYCWTNKAIDFPDYNGQRIAVKASNIF